MRRLTECASGARGTFVRQLDGGEAAVSHTSRAAGRLFSSPSHRHWQRAEERRAQSDRPEGAGGGQIEGKPEK